jgi:hypothetical protein
VSEDAASETRRNVQGMKMNEQLSSTLNFENSIGQYQGLFDDQIYKIAYEHLKSKPGNMTPGTDEETLDGISVE